MTEPFRVIIVEDDPDVALFTKTVLEKREFCVVMMIADPRLVVSAVESFQPELMLTDIELPGMSGLELIAQVRAIRPGIPVIVMTAHASLDYALTALRSQADEFLTKPVLSADLVSHVGRLAQAGRERAAAAPKRQVVLAIGAHPDDVEIGVGGILAAHIAAGDPVTILTLSRGFRDGGIRTAWDEGSASAAVIGAKLVLEENQGSSISAAEPTIGTIRKVIEETNPSVVYVHTRNDQHQDHRAVHDATLVAAGTADTVACYQGSGATVDFRPNRFVSIDGFTDSKLAMLACFARQSEPSKYLQPDFALATARAWSRYGQGDYCEPLEIIRDSTELV